MIQLNEEINHMVVNPELLKLLVCPETKQPVNLVDDSVLQKVNLYISKGEVVNKSGVIIEYQLTGGLITDDEKTLYPIRDDIPVMLVADSFSMEQFNK